MSLMDLTSKCFQNGMSAKKWVGLCRLLKKQVRTFEDDSEFESKVCNSILRLFSPHPGDLSLQAYIEAALQDGLEASTLDNLCRLILNHHYASGLPPNNSLVRLNDSVTDVMTIAHDSLVFLRASTQIPSSPYHSLSTSAGELTLLLISCIGEPSQVSNQLIVMSYATALDIMHNPDIEQSIRSGIQNLMEPFRSLIDDDVKMVHEMQVIQTMQVSLGKADGAGSSTPSDITSCSLLLRHLVEHRTSFFGAGNTAGAVAMLIGSFQWSQWSAQVFYTQLLQAAVSCLAQSVSHQYTFRIWMSFVIARIPQLLTHLEMSLAANSESPQESDGKKALQAALLALKNRADLLSHLDSAELRSEGDEPEPDVTKGTTQLPAPFFRTLIKSFWNIKAIDGEFAQRIEPDILKASIPSLLMEETESGQELAALVESKFSAETSFEEASAFLQRTLDDVTNHTLISTAIYRRFDALCSSGKDAASVEGLSILCKLLNANDLALDIIALEVKITDIVAAALHFVDNFDCELVGDPQTAVGHLGSVVLFLQSTIVRYQLVSFQFEFKKKPVKADFLFSTTATFRRQELNAEEGGAYIEWTKALFFSSEGIEDGILRSTKPKSLLKLAATLVFNGVRFHSDRKIDLEVLNNGISYFTGDLLNWTLVGVIKSLLQEIIQKDTPSPILYGILQNLIEAPSIPRPVLCLTGHGVLAMLEDSQTTTFKPIVLRDAVKKALGETQEETSDSSLTSLSLPKPKSSYVDHPRTSIRDAFSAARAGKAPSLDVSRGVLILGPGNYLRVLWSELQGAAMQYGSDMDLYHRIGTHALTCPPLTFGHSQIPPLLPIFLHGGMLHGLLKAIDHQLPAEQTLNVELLVSIITSSLNAVLQMEWALRSVEAELKHPMGQTAVLIARRLNADLKRSNCTSAARILQRLSSSASFVANFPVMALPGVTQ